MLQSNSHLLRESSSSWDTGYARKFLKIPQDQLEMIDNIPGWSMPEKEISGKSFDKSGRIETDKYTTYSQPTDSVEQINLFQSQPVINLRDNLGSKTNVSPITVAAGSKISLWRSASFSVLNKLDNPLKFLKFKSNSVPTLAEKQEIMLNMSNEHTSSASIIKNKQLDQTYVVSGFTHDKMKKSSPEKLSVQEVEGSVQPLRKKNIERLSDHILNHKFFKGSSHSVAMVTSDSKSQISNAEVPEEKRHNKLDTRLKLLEKRFSSSDFTTLSDPMFSAAVISSQVKLTGTQNSSCDNVSGTDHKSNTLKVRDITGKNPLEHQNGFTTDKISSSNLEQSLKGYNEKEQTIEGAIFSHEETFVSQPIPCGQPINDEANAAGLLEDCFQDELIPCEQSSNKQPTDEKEANTSLNEVSIVPGQQPLLIATTVPRPDLQTKSADEMLIHSSKNAESILSVPLKNTGTPTSYISSKCKKTVEVQETPSGKIGKSGVKRKRKTNGRTSGNIRDSKKLSIVDIHFTADQIKNMIDLIKMFQSI